MAIVPTGFINAAQLESAIKKAIRKLGKDVVRVNYSVGTDWADDPAIYFRVVLTDAASRDDKLLATANRVEAILSDDLRPYENWGLLPYFNFRRNSEQRERNDPEWS